MQLFEMESDYEMRIPTESYAQQSEKWPSSGRHILANFDDATIIVYQAYSKAIGDFAVKHQHFGGDFSYARMSWIKPNFLWMMYRSDWGRSKGQEVVLAVRVRRSYFDSLLKQAVPSSFVPRLFDDHEEWKAAVKHSDVRLQWDPDHFPNGGRCERRAIQIGLRGATLEAYGQDEVLEILDLSDFVAEQRRKIRDHDSLLTPVEDVYTPLDRNLAQRLNLAKHPCGD